MFSEKDNLPDDDELKIVAELREAFSEEFQKRTELGTNHEFLWGDIGLGRVVRGNKGSLDDSKKWMTRCFKTFDEARFGAKNDITLDQLIVNQRKTMEDRGWAPLSSDMFPHMEECSKYANFDVLDAKTTDGDTVVYFPVSDLDSKGLVDEAKPNLWPMYCETCSAMNSAVAMVNDRESRSRGRVVKMIVLYDFQDSALSDVMYRPFTEKFDKEVNKVFESIFADQVGRIYMIRSPWWLTKLWSVITTILPKQLTYKMSISSTQDAAEIAETTKVSEMNLMRMFSSRKKKKEEDGANSGEVQIKAGGHFERVVEVKANQTVSWSFDVSQTLTFVGKAWWFDEEATSEGGGEADIVVPSAEVAKDDGTVTGELEVASDGLMLLSWDNVSSLVSSSTLKYELTAA